MSKKHLPVLTVRVTKIVGGGQTLGSLDDGRKVFVWGAVPGELVEVQLTKRKSNYAEGFVTAVIEASPDRIPTVEPDSFISTSPWQIMSPALEHTTKIALIDDAFTLHHVTLPAPSSIYSDDRLYDYRNKIEFSWWYDTETDMLDLAFFRRGNHRKIPVAGSQLAMPVINEVATRLRDILRDRQANGFQLKTVLIRASQKGEVIAQLYVKDPDFPILTSAELARLDATGFELIYSNPQSPASVITERLQQHGLKALSDTILDVPFTYATEGFFQINLPVYEKALLDMKEWVEPDKPTIDLYSGVGSIGLTIGQENVTMVELNPAAVREMEANIAALGRTSATAVLAASEKALEYISAEATIILDPPRAGLDSKVVEKLLEVTPDRIIYLSCNPVTQARDIALLLESYDIAAQQGYNFFPRTPHIEHLIVLNKRSLTI
jgi:23S rRNA (uracil1939-C5)-methyltransferase